MSSQSPDQITRLLQAWRDGDTVATVSKRWFRVRDTYGVQIAPGHDVALILAITVCVDAMSDRGN